MFDTLRILINNIWMIQHFLASLIFHSHASQSIFPCPPSDLGYCSEAVITAFIKKFIPKAALAENIGTELSYQLPLSSARNQQMSKLFSELELNLDKLYLSSYGLSDTSLEEVLL